MKTLLIFLSMLFSLFSGNVFPTDIPVTLAIDQHCQSKRHCKLLKSTIQDISKEFQREYGFGFRVMDCKPWTTAGGGQSISKLLAGLIASVPAGRAGIVIGLTGKRSVTGKKGKSYYQQGYVLVRKKRSPRTFKQLLRHEIYHLFGATHVVDSDSLMDENLRGTRVKSINRKIVALHRDRIFSRIRFPVAASQLEELAGLYHEIARYNEKRQLRRPRLPEDVYLSLALVYIEMKKYPEAIRQCEKAAAIDARREEAYNLMGIAARRGGQPEKAIQCYRKIIEINPSHPSIYRNMGIAYMNMKPAKNSEALEAFSRAIKLAPNHAELYKYRGQIQARMGDNKEAEKAYLKCIELEPRNGRVHYKLAVVYYESKQYKKALEHLRLAENLGVAVQPQFKKILLETLK